jgi:hypothetical protein
MENKQKIQREKDKQTNKDKKHQQRTNKPTKVKNTNKGQTNKQR